MIVEQLKPRELGVRLKTVLQNIRAGLPVWDICCDHGYLGEAAIRQGLSREVHFVDAVPEIIDRLEARLVLSGVVLGSQEVSSLSDVLSAAAQNSSELNAPAQGSHALNTLSGMSVRVSYHRTRAQNLNWNEMWGTAVICGIGAERLIHILEMIPSEKSSNLRLILGPQKRPNLIVEYCQMRNWKMDSPEGTAVIENGRSRFLFVVDMI